MHLDDGSADRQPQAQSPEVLGDRVVALLEGIEDALKVLRGDPDPAVGNLCNHLSVHRPAAHTHAAAARRELDSILQQVPEAVSYTHLRAHETRHDLVCRLLLE